MLDEDNMFEIRAIAANAKDQTIRLETRRSIEGASIFITKSEDGFYRSVLQGHEENWWQHPKVIGKHHLIKWMLAEPKKEKEATRSVSWDPVEKKLYLEERNMKTLQWLTCICVGKTGQVVEEVVVDHQPNSKIDKEKK